MPTAYFVDGPLAGTRRSVGQLKPYIEIGIFPGSMSLRPPSIHVYHAIGRTPREWENGLGFDEALYSLQPGLYHPEEDMWRRFALEVLRRLDAVPERELEYHLSRKQERGFC